MARITLCLVRLQCNNLFFSFSIFLRCFWVFVVVETLLILNSPKFDPALTIYCECTGIHVENLRTVQYRIRCSRPPIRRCILQIGGPEIYSPENVVQVAIDSSQEDLAETLDPPVPNLLRGVDLQSYKYTTGATPVHNVFPIATDHRLSP